MPVSYEDTQKANLRNWLAGKLKLGDDAFQTLWEALVVDTYVEEALNPDYPDAKDKLLERARYLLDLSKRISHSTGGHASGPHVPPHLIGGDPVWERAYAAVPYLLKRLGRHPAVVKLRRRLGAPLSAEEARSLIYSRQAAESGSEIWEKRLFWNGERMFVNVETGSMLWELAELAERLPPGPWETARIGWWVLTGETPAIHPLRAEVRAGAWPTLTLTAPLWAPVDAVESLYKDTKHSPALQEAFKLGPTPSPRRLTVFRFVAERSEFQGPVEPRDFKPRRSWRGLMQLWNERLPAGHKWRYADVRNFRRDFKKAKEALFCDEDFLKAQEALFDR